MYHQHQNGNGRAIVLDRAILARVAERLDRLTDRPSPTACHLFKGHPHPTGWIRMAVGAEKTWSAARLAWLVAHGSLPLGARVYHACGSASCHQPEPSHPDQPAPPPAAAARTAAG